MITKRGLVSLGLALVALATAPCRAVELRVSRDALERTLERQLFNSPGGRYYLKGSPGSSCSVYAEDARLRFVQDRIVVQVKTHARMGKAVRGACLGISLAPTAEVSLEPYGEGEIIGFRDAQLIKVSDQRELNFLLAPFLKRQVPSGMQVNAADLLRKALTESLVPSGYQVTLDRLKVHSIQIQGDSLIVDVEGGLSVK